MKEIKENLDVHALNEKAFELPSRLVAKRYLFRTIFRGSGYAFSLDPDFSHVSSDPSFWDDINVKFYKKYSGLDRCHKRWVDCVLRGDPLVGPTGRYWPVPLEKDSRGNLKIPWPTITNRPVQGTAADILTVARVSLRKRLTKYVKAAKLISTVHDSIVVDAPALDRIPEIMYDVFRDIPENFKRIYKYEMNVPYECELKIGPNLTDMETYEPAI